MGITYEEKAFYDILLKVRDDNGFPSKWNEKVFEEVREQTENIKIHQE
jgi:hypothetical protein